MREAPMPETRFAPLRRRLPLVISRRRTLHSLAALAASLAPALVPEASEAGHAKRRCLKSQGSWLAPDRTSPCRCVGLCEDASFHPCHKAHPGCFCAEKVDDGRGFCTTG